MKEIARRERVDDSYVSRMVNLTTLAPDIVAAILDETLPSEIMLFELAAGTPVPKPRGHRLAVHRHGLGYSSRGLYRTMTPFGL